MSLSKLPRELILTVGDNLPILSLSRLLQTCRSLHQLLSPALTTRITTENLASSILLNGIRNNHLPTVTLALAHNAAWHTFDKYGHCCSALQRACDMNRLEIVALLITHYGATILTANQTPTEDYCHENPLDSAIRSKNLALTTLLLERGAPANQTVWYGYPSSDKSPLDFAGKYGTGAIAEVLIRYGAEVLHAGRSLSYAVRSGRWDVVRVLLREGVGVWAHNYEWAELAPLGARSEREIEAWVAAGTGYMVRCWEESLARRIAAGQRRAEEDDGEVEFELGDGV